MNSTRKWSKTELRTMALALPVIEDVPVEQDTCWPGDGPSHDDHCHLADHTESAAAVQATAGVSWEFDSWSATHATWRRILDSIVSDFIDCYEDDDEISTEELEEMFLLAYERPADDEDYEEDSTLWSLICAAVHASNRLIG